MSNTKKITFAALFIAIGIVLPFFTAQLQSLGNMLTPMHFPVLISGLTCGPAIGLIVGIITPLLRSILFHMPYMFPNAIAMAFELGTYGLIAGLTLNKLNFKNIYISLILAMLSGRLVWGIVMMFISGISSSAFSMSIFFASAFINSTPGILLQLLIIPFIVKLLKKHFTF